jgi:hypothetical protein
VEPSIAAPIRTRSEWPRAVPPVNGRRRVGAVRIRTLTVSVAVRVWVPTPVSALVKVIVVGPYERDDHCFRVPASMVPPQHRHLENALRRPPKRSALTQFRPVGRATIADRGHHFLASPVTLRTSHSSSALKPAGLETMPRDRAEADAPNHAEFHRRHPGLHSR